MKPAIHRAACHDSDSGIRPGDVGPNRFRSTQGQAGVETTI
jgi:hypothetical protein